MISASVSGWIQGTSNYGQIGSVFIIDAKSILFDRAAFGIYLIS